MLHEKKTPRYKIVYSVILTWSRVCKYIEMTYRNTSSGKLLVVVWVIFISFLHFLLLLYFLGEHVLVFSCYLKHIWFLFCIEGCRIEAWEKNHGFYG